MARSRFFISMAILLGLLMGSISLAGCGQSPVAVEIAYLNHPPVQAVLVDVNKVLAKYEKQLQVTRYDIGTPEGAAFLKNKNLNQGSVLAIFVNGSIAYQKSDQQVQFISFPVGKGTAMMRAGNWTVDDLDAALAAATNSKK
jgi:hypothetical protein